MKRRVFIDMDGVIVDFDRAAKEQAVAGDVLKTMKGAYLRMEAVDGALTAVRSIIGMGYDVWIATKPPTGIAWAYADKAAWIFQHLPELSRKLVITHDKGMLGGPADILIDDRPHKANCEAFQGLLLRFGHDGMNWPRVLAILRLPGLRDGDGPTKDVDIRLKFVEPRLDPNAPRERFMAELDIGLERHRLDPLREMLDALRRPPREGTLVADLTDAERMALCHAAGVPIETAYAEHGMKVLLRTTVPCGIADSGDGRYIVVMQHHRLGGK